jgi:lipopolysaccharide/colanic/teichoic acid biosynthesis glycosyltransferase
MMFNAPVTSTRYACSMRSVRSRQRFRHEFGTPEQMKRLIDALLGCVLLLMSGPLLLLITLAIKLESPGPALVSNDCIGLGGRRFQMLKFRTLPHDPSRNTARWRQKPTEVGKILRFTRLEVLPQLINVIRGEMSIIEPDGRSPSFLD